MEQLYGKSMRCPVVGPKRFWNDQNYFVLVQNFWEWYKLFRTGMNYYGSV